MKIYFTSNKDKDNKTYKLFEEWFKKEKHQLVFDLNQADVVIVETEIINKEIKELIFSTLMASKTVLLLYDYHGDRPKNIVKLADKKILKNFHLKGYVPSGLANTLEKFFTDLTTAPRERFNLFITKDVEEYLDWIPYGTGQSRSEFIRSLVMDRMEKDRGYNDYKKKK